MKQSKELQDKKINLEQGITLSGTDKQNLKKFFELLIQIDKKLENKDETN